MSKNFLDFAALVVAVAAIIISLVEQRQNTRRHKEATERDIQLSIEQVKPQLQMIFKKNDHEQMKGISLRNVGAGPARILDFKIYLNQSDFEEGRYYTEWLNSEQILILCCAPFQLDYVQVPYPGYVLQEGTDNEIFLLGDADSMSYHSRLIPNMDSLIIELHYNSLTELDTSTYFLRYCENFKANNVYDSAQTNLYEWQ